MTRHILQLNNRDDRLKAHQGIDRAPNGWTLELRAAKRTDEQNRALWSLLNQIQRQRPEHRGIPMSPELWKAVFMDALNSDSTIMPKLDEAGYFPMHSTSRLTKSEFADLLTIMLAWTAREGLTIQHFDEPEPADRSSYSRDQQTGDRKSRAEPNIPPNKPAGEGARIAEVENA